MQHIAKYPKELIENFGRKVVRLARRRIAQKVRLDRDAIRSMWPAYIAMLNSLRKRHAGRAVEWGSVRRFLRRYMHLRRSVQYLNQIVMLLISAVFFILLLVSFAFQTWLPKSMMGEAGDTVSTAFGIGVLIAAISLLRFSRNPRVTRWMRQLLIFYFVAGLAMGVVIPPLRRGELAIAGLLMCAALLSYVAGRRTSSAIARAVVRRRWRQLSSVEPEAIVISGLVSILAGIDDDRSWRSARWRQWAVNALHFSARSVEDYFDAASGRGLDPIWPSERGVEIAGGINELTRWILLPGPTTQVDLRERMLDMLRVVARSEWSSMPRCQVAPASGSHGRLLAVSRLVKRLAAAVLPLAAAVLAPIWWPTFHQFPSHDWIIAAAACWAIVNLLLLLDPDAARVGDAASPLLSYFLGREGKGK